MARGVNKVILIGNLGQDPEVRFLPSGNPVANLRLATTDTWMDKQSGQKQERTEWHTLVMFNKLAEIAQQYVKKGSKIYVEGRLQTRKWQGQDGQDRYSTEIVVNDMQMLDSRQGGQQQGGYQQPPPQQGGYQQPPPTQQGGYQQQPPPQQQGYQQQPPPQQQGMQPPPQQQPPQGGNPNQGQHPPPQQQRPPQGNPNYGAPNPGAYDDFDDEIPFMRWPSMMGG